MLAQSRAIRSIVPRDVDIEDDSYVRKELTSAPFNLLWLKLTTPVFQRAADLVGMRP